MTHCCACSNAPLMFPLERRSVCDGALCVCVCVKISHLTTGQLSFPVCVCVYLKRQWEGESDGRKKQNERGKVRKCLRGRRGEKKNRLIHTAGTVVTSPASLTLAAVRSDTSTVDTLLGAASCWWETHFFLYNRPRFVEKKKKVQVFSSSSTARCLTLLHAEERKQTHKQTNKQTH